MKPFAYVNAASEKDAIAALGPERGKFLPLAGGMDLLALMKDYVAQPDRLVNVKDWITPSPGRPRADCESARPLPLTPLASTRRRSAVSRARRGGGRSGHAADPQRRHRRRQSQPAPALLVLPQRRIPRA